MSNHVDAAWVSFSDVDSNHENHEAIEHLGYYDVIEGYSDGTFRPDSSVNRAELVKIIVETLDLEFDSSEYLNCFPDVKEEWFAPYVCYGKEQGWIEGYPDGYYRPGNEVNKVEAAKIIENALFEETAWTEYLDSYDYYSLEHSFGNWADADPKAWYAPHLSLLDNLNLLDEDSFFFHPAMDMNRGSAAEMIYRAFLVTENEWDEFDPYLRDEYRSETFKIPSQRCYASTSAAQDMEAFQQFQEYISESGLSVEYAYHCVASTYFLFAAAVDGELQLYLFDEEMEFMDVKNLEQCSGNEGSVRSIESVEVIQFDLHCILKDPPDFWPTGYHITLDENLNLEVSALEATFELGEQQKINDLIGGFDGELGERSHLGQSVTTIGDLDNDGVEDLAVGERGDDGGESRGGVWILFMNSDRTVKDQQKISDTEGGFVPRIGNYASFGVSLAGLGDLNGDGVEDLAVGVQVDNDGASGAGAIWILFLNEDGTVKDQQKISNTYGGLGNVLALGDYFGEALANIGDLNGDGVIDIAVSVRDKATGQSNIGAFWILFMNQDGTVKSSQKVGDNQGGFDGPLDEEDHFGNAISSAGDLNRDGVLDIAVTSSANALGFTGGTTWILFMNSNGTVRSYSLINNENRSFVAPSSDHFGDSIANMGDLNGDGNNDLVLGTSNGSTEAVRGLWIYFMDRDGTLKSYQKLDLSEVYRWPYDEFGLSIAAGPETNSIVVGARSDGDLGNDHGAIWILDLVD
ncbi:FG-GAP repeat protein [Candidatus Peregrinibacteria bacterium]|nr:MAG: FG-GAP repeat protein [Candidatus Peregrinibacteria bacterium]